MTQSDSNPAGRAQQVNHTADGDHVQSSGLDMSRERHSMGKPKAIPQAEPIAPVFDAEEMARQFAASIHSFGQ